MANMLPGVDPKFHFFFVPSYAQRWALPRFAPKTEKQTWNENVSRSIDVVDKCDLKFVTKVTCMSLLARSLFKHQQKVVMLLTQLLFVCEQCGSFGVPIA